jgi:CubicO group peptidase (beta-lactamase class C family)
MNIKFKIIFLILVVCHNGFSAESIQQLKDGSTINVLDVHDFVTKWIVLGPFPNRAHAESPSIDEKVTGFNVDFLAELGGERKAILSDKQKLSYSDHEGNTQILYSKRVEAGSDGIIDFEKEIGRLDYKVAYAFCYLQADTEQVATFLLGSDDGVKVWINGELVHENDIGRGINPGDDTFTAKLNVGPNRILVKVTQGVRGWGFVLEALNEEGIGELNERIRKDRDFNIFLNTGLVPRRENTWNYFFTPGQFPDLEWDRPYLVEQVYGQFPLKIRWFDKNGNEVRSADSPGRYGYYAEGFTPDGTLIRRGGTFYCMPSEWIAWGERPSAELEYLLIPGVKKDNWSENQKAIADFTGRIALLSILRQKEGAILMSYIDELENRDQKDSKIFTPIIEDHEYQLALKRKILDLNDSKAELKPPARLNNPSKILQSNYNEKNFKPGTAEKLRKVCSDWYLESGEPFVMLIARRGDVLLHEAFGKRADGLVYLNTVTEIASTTKLITGVLFAQFVDQGLIDIDDPVGKFLPDFPTEGDKVITLRHCFTHTSGLWGHEEWGGLHNPWLDNAVANLLPRLDVGKMHNYNGMGYDLAGKVMEVVSGKSIFRLMREHLFDPLGLENTLLEEDLGFGCHSTAGDLAVIGQLLLNKGSYGELQFFTEITFNEILPKSLNTYYPDINIDWGIGLTWMRESHPDAGKNSNPDDLTILSKNIIGHGSATATILRVDLDNELVISQTRRQGGKAYEKNLKELLLTIEEGLIN